MDRMDVTGGLNFMYEDIAEKIVDLMTENGYMELAENPELKMAETMDMAGSILEPGYMEMICDYVRQIADEHTVLVLSAEKPYPRPDDMGERALKVLDDISDSFRCSLAADRLMSFRREHPEDMARLDALQATDTRSTEDILWRGDMKRIRGICDVLADAALRDGAEPENDLYDEMTDIGQKRRQSLGLAPEKTTEEKSDEKEK